MQTPVVRIVRMLVLIGLGAGGAGSLRAQQVASVADVRDQVDEVFTAYDHSDTPGCALGVVLNGELAYARGFGMANLDYGIAIDPRSVFRIGSTSKQFTAAAIVLAAQEGALSLDDDIRDWLPEMPDYGTPITIRMLLNHTSGIRDYLTLAELAGLRDDDWYTDEEALALIAKQQRTNFDPGSEHLYSNSGYFLLSQIIRRATGRSLRQYAEEEIFEPLGMDDTHYHDDHTEIVPDRASGYAPEGEGFRISMTTLDMVGDGGVFTTVEDLQKWDENFYDPRVGGPQLVTALLERGVLSSGDTIDYALGLIHGEHRGLPVVSHGGSFVGYRAEMIRFPEQRLSVATLCNVSNADPTSLSFDVAELFLADYLESETVAPDAEPAAAAGAEPVALSEGELARWAGLYREEGDGGYLRLEVRDGALTAVVGPGFPLIPIASDRFRLDFVPIEIRFSGAPGERTFELRRPDRTEHFAEVEPAVLTPATAAALAGRYHSTELDVDYLIEADGAVLSLRRGRGGPISLRPTVEHEFTLNGEVLTFEPPDEGDVPEAFTVDAGRVRGIRFERVGEGT